MIFTIILPFTKCPYCFVCVIYKTKVQNVNDLRQRLIDVLVGIEHIIINNAIDQWHRHLYACFKPEENIMNIHCDTYY